MNQQDPASNGSNNATNNIQEPVVGQNLFPTGSVQTPMAPETNDILVVFQLILLFMQLSSNHLPPIIQQVRQLLRRQHRT